MRKIVLSLAIAVGLTASSYAQTAVALTNVLDVASPNVGNVYAATYSVADNKFLASNAGAAIRVYNGTTGAYESDLNITGTNPVGLGFFALTAGTDGSIFGFIDTAGTLWQWANVTAAPVNAVASGVLFARCGNVIETGNSTKVALAGSANNGPVEIYSTANDVTYTLLETVPALASPAGVKSCFGINTAMAKIWGIGDSFQAINKQTKSGSTWSLDPTFVPPAATDGCASLVYDNLNNVLFAFIGSTIYALHGDTGADLSSGGLAVANGINGTPGYAGGIVSSTPGSGTLWFAGRGATATDATLHKVTYTVTGAGVENWSMY